MVIKISSDNNARIIKHLKVKLYILLSIIHSTETSRVLPADPQLRINSAIPGVSNGEGTQHTQRPKSDHCRILAAESITKILL